MSDTIIQAVPGDLGQDWCPDSWQALYFAFLAKTVWKIPGIYKPYVVSATQPSVDDQDKIWIKTTSTGAAIGVFLYEPTYGWIWPHSLAPDELRDFEGDITALDTYDGGAVGAVGPITGPMWKLEREILFMAASVRVATTGPGALATDFENGDTIDGVVLATGDRVLIWQQASAVENGIYTVNVTGAPTRAADARVSAALTKGLYVPVTLGTVNVGKAFVLTSADPITLGATSLAFVEYTGAQTSGKWKIRRTARLYLKP